MDPKQFHDLVEDWKIVLVIKREIEWQQRHWGDENSVKDTVIDRLKFIDKHTKQAQEAMDSGDQEKALSEILTLTAICIQTMMTYPPKEREDINS